MQEKNDKMIKIRDRSNDPEQKKRILTVPAGTERREIVGIEGNSDVRTLNMDSKTINYDEIESAIGQKTRK